MSKLGEFRLAEYPAMTIGRLAVQKEWQGKGIGRHLIYHIAIEALSCLGVAGVRLLLVQAKQEAFDFYEKMGFDYVKEVKRERKHLKLYGTRTMFFDLTEIDSLLI